MNFIALKMLLGDRAKYLGIVMGLTFASLLITQQSAIFVGLMTRTFGPITDLGLPDVWVMDPKVQFIDDINKLLSSFRRLLDAGASLIVIEHNLDVVKTADWIIDLGPEGGDEGGRIVTVGTPEEIVNVKASHTGRFLREHLRG